jgi:hypothetical protein
MKKLHEIRILRVTGHYHNNIQTFLFSHCKGTNKNVGSAKLPLTQCCEIVARIIINQ